MAVNSFYTLYNLGIQSSIPLSIKPDAPSLLNVRIFQSSEFEMVDLKEEEDSQRLGFQLFVGGDHERAYLHWKKEQLFIKLLIESGTSIKVHTNVVEKEVLSVFVLNEAMGMILFQRGYFLLHASAIQLEQEAVVFMGEPGMGKSTLVASFANAGIPILSDDLVVIKLDAQNNPMLISGPPRIKIWSSTVEELGMSFDHLLPLYEGSKKMLWNLEDNETSEILPLRHLYQLIMLEDDEGNNQSSFINLKGFAAIQALFSHSSIPSYFLTDDKRQKRTIDCMRILEKVPITNIIRPKNFSLIKQQIASIRSLSKTR